MKKKILCLFTAFLCAVFCFSGCGLGSYIDNENKHPSHSGNTKPDDPTTPPDDQPDLSTHYRVNVFYQNTVFTPDDNKITVVWRNDFDIKRVELGADGTADAGELDGEYTVYLEGLPSKYAYNPNGYTATADARLVSILLTDIVSPVNATSADGKKPYINQGCYDVRYDGTYRTVLNSEDDLRYYEYTPTASGIYSIASCVNIYDDAINPIVDIFGGTIGYKWYVKTLDGGGASLAGGFTKNFRYEVNISPSEVGGSFTFAIKAESKKNEYPLYVDFIITYEGEYKNSYEDVRVIRTAEKRLIKAAEPKAGEKFIYSDLGTKQFLNANYKYNEETGRYHVYSMELYGDNSYGFGAGYGPSLLCAIKPKVPAYSMTSLYNANSVPNPLTGSASNYLRLYNMWLEEEQKYVTYDYTEFIRTDYNNVCNSQGYCYVTKELKQFLHDFADKNNLWSDNTMSELLTGTPEILGYKANEDSLWLFACGFYAKATPNL